MCGIAGLIAFSGQRPDPERVTAAVASMAHRGPDGHGLQERVGPGVKACFGHGRLAIIELSDAGLQPMTTPDGRYTITYNGELYNYVELRRELQAAGVAITTQTDTEVLLKAWAHWGEDALQRFDGMFAFAVFDSKLGTVTLVRDSFGIKPLFYAHRDDHFAFASEVQAMQRLLPGPAQVNWQQAYSYLCWGSYDDGCDTFYADIKHVAPGHFIVLDAKGQSRTRRWWWPNIEETCTLSFSDASEKLRHLFLASVRRQLRSDVPLGAALSGGIDSSAIVCAMRHLEPDMPIHTFSYAASNPAQNERIWAETVVEHVGAISHWVDGEARELDVDIDNVIKAQGEPFGSTSIALQCQIYQLARQNGITVTLDGQGADELLGGYDGYPVALLRNHYDRGRFGKIATFPWRWGQYPGRGLHAALMNMGDAFSPDMLRTAGLRLAGFQLVPDWMSASGLYASGVTPRPPKSLFRGTEAKGRRLAESLRHALTTDRLPALLRHGDRNSMRWSVESRVPFLTPELANFCLSLPEDYLVSPAYETKRLFKDAMRGIVPDAILQRRDKIGFQTPERHILSAQRERISTWLEAADRVPFFKPDEVRARVWSVLEGRSRFTFQAWRIINFCRWLSLQPIALPDAIPRETKRTSLLQPASLGTTKFTSPTRLQPKNG